MVTRGEIQNKDMYNRHGKKLKPRNTQTRIYIYNY